MRPHTGTAPPVEASATESWAAASNAPHGLPRTAAILIWAALLALSCLGAIYLQEIEGICAGLATLLAFVAFIGLAAAIPHGRRSAD